MKRFLMVLIILLSPLFSLFGYTAKELKEFPRLRNLSTKEQLIVRLNAALIKQKNKKDEKGLAHLTELIKQGADLNWKSTYKLFFFIEDNDEHRMHDDLLQAIQYKEKLPPLYPHLTTWEDKGLTFWHLLCALDDPHLLKWALKNGLDPQLLKLSSKLGYGIFHIAAKYMSINTVHWFREKVILAKKELQTVACITTKNKENPFHLLYPYIFDRVHYETMLRELTDFYDTHNQRALINARNKDGHTPFAQAVKECPPDQGPDIIQIAKILKKYGADITYNYKEIDRSPLGQVMGRYINPEVALYLLKEGTDTSLFLKESRYINNGLFSFLLPRFKEKPQFNQNDFRRYYKKGYLMISLGEKSNDLYVGFPDGIQPKNNPLSRILELYKNPIPWHIGKEAFQEYKKARIDRYSPTLTEHGKVDFQRLTLLTDETKFANPEWYWRNNLREYALGSGNLPYKDALFIFNH